MQETLCLALVIVVGGLACSACDEPARYPLAASVAATPAAEPKLTSVEVVAPPAPPVVFEDLFLQDADAREGMHHIVTPQESRPDHKIFVCYGGPGGKQSALSEWGDPHSNEALWRLVDLRWVFDDVTGAEAFRGGLVAHFEKKHWKSMPCDAPLGDACTRLFSGTEDFHGDPHTEIGFLFRVGAVVAEVSAGEGPRVGAERISDALLMPFAKRAEERVREATTAATSSRRR